MTAHLRLHTLPKNTTAVSAPRRADARPDDAGRAAQAALSAGLVTKERGMRAFSRFASSAASSSAYLPQERPALSSLRSSHRLSTSLASVATSSAVATSSSSATLTERWLERVVIGKKLCPFAPPVKAKLRLLASVAADEEEIVAEVATEARLLHQGILTPSDKFPETTLLVLPTLDCTATWQAFVHLSWRLQSDAIVATGLAEHLQLVLFHPAAVHSIYADMGTEDAADFSIRSPFPTVHLLREVDMLAAVQRYPDAAGIPARNKARLRALGVQACTELWRGLGETGDSPG